MYLRQLAIALACLAFLTACDADLVTGLKPQLTAQDTPHLSAEAFFHLLDQNGDGKLSSREAIDGTMQALKVDSRYVDAYLSTLSSLRDIFQRDDLNRDGHLTPDEFSDWYDMYTLMLI